MRVLAFSDVHCHERSCRRLVEQARDVDLVIGAGDFGSQHHGVEQTVAILHEITTPTVVVPGNNETETSLREACSGWEAVTVLHGSATKIGDAPVFGLGAGIPTTPWGWSFDLTEDQAREHLAACPSDAILVVHSPPRGHVDVGSGGDHLGSEAILESIKARQPRLVVCGHIHDSWGQESSVGSSLIINAGPQGRIIELA